MGFWDGVKAVGKFIGDAVEKRKQRIMETKERYSHYDDDYLLRKYRNTSDSDVRIACGMLLKERGYTSSDLQL